MSRVRFLGVEVGGRGEEIEKGEEKVEKRVGRRRRRFDGDDDGGCWLLVEGWGDGW